MDRVVEGLCRFFIFLVDRCIERRQPPKKAKFKIDPTEDDEANLDRDPKPSWLVYVGASASLLSAVSVGFCLGYNSPALPSMIYNGTHYANDTATYRIVSSEDTNTLSWIGSVMGVGALVGSLLSGPTNQYFGRKIGLILSAVGSTFSWLLIAMTLNAAHLILFRLLTGFFAGLSCGIAPTYCAEIATKEIRGRLGTYFQIGITIGIFLMSALGLAFHWRNLAIVCILAPFCTAILLLFVPETPYFLLKCRPNDPNYALNKSLRPLRDAKSPLQKELNEILSTVQTGSAAFFSLEMFTQRDFLSPLHHALLLMFFQQFSGINTIISYQEYTLQKLFSHMENSKFYASIGASISCFLQVVATIFSAFLIDQCGRKQLLVISAGGHFVSLIGFAIYLFVDSHNVVLPIIFLSLFLISFSIGWGPIPWLMIPELSRNDYRAAIASLGSAFNWINAFLITKLFLLANVYVAPSSVYAFFAVICIISALYVFFFLPETRNKDLNAIEFSEALTFATSTTDVRDDKEPRDLKNDIKQLKQLKQSKEPKDTIVPTEIKKVKSIKELKEIKKDTKEESPS